MCRTMVSNLLLLLLFFGTHILGSSAGVSGDAKALLAIKIFVDTSNALPWKQDDAGNVCNWTGVTECSHDGRVRKLVVEFFNLTGEIPRDALVPLDQLRVLSFKSNSLSGNVPDLSSLLNLKILYLNDNFFSGRIPACLPKLHRLKIVVLAGNLLSGGIPPSIADVPLLYAFLVQDNRITGEIPPLGQLGLRYFNVSNNRLQGEIPKTRALSRFDHTSFLNNPSLCGRQVELTCSSSSSSSTSAVSGSPPVSSSVHSENDLLPPNDDKNKKRVAAIVGGSLAAFLVLAVSLVIFACCFFGYQTPKPPAHAPPPPATERPAPAVAGNNSGPSAPPVGASAGGKRGFSWEAEGLGKLVFCGGVGEMYSLEDLLKATAESLGKGTIGSTYKAVMESGFIVTVKRLKDSGNLALEEFRRRMEVLGRLRHPNLVPMRAYFQAKDERLLIYDYFHNGSLSNLVHGTRPSEGGKPLHWTSCLKIAEDVANGLLYLHQTPGMVHGNLKSTNVLLGSDFESCLTDYCLVPSFRSPEMTEEAAAMFYRAPEARRRPTTNRSFTAEADVYSFGVVLIELLTGKRPFRDLVEPGGLDVARWVRTVREEESESGDEQSSEDSVRFGLLTDITVACLSVEPGSRPSASDLVRMVREARAEAVVVSSGGGSDRGGDRDHDRDHSPGRWSDTVQVQSLPREYGSEHFNFAERD